VFLLDLLPSSVHSICLLSLLLLLNLSLVDLLGLLGCWLLSPGRSAGAVGAVLLSLVDLLPSCVHRISLLNPLLFLDLLLLDLLALLVLFQTELV